jgi:hypothetical protein
MAVYLNIFNLIIDKKAICDKYSGGLNKFRKDYDIPASLINQEDGQVFSLGQMNSDQFNIDALIENGLSFDENLQYSDDFTIIYRYGDAFWDVDWLKHNKVFAWHIDSNALELEKINEISNTSMDEIIKLKENGHNLLTTIWILS